MSSVQFPIVIAQAAAGGLGGNVIFFLALFAIMYFVLIRPQQKQAKEAQNLLTALKKGDNVITSAGIVGEISAVLDDKFIQLEIAKGVKVRLLKSSVQARVNVDAAKADSAEPKKEEK